MSAFFHCCWGVNRRRCLITSDSYTIPTPSPTCAMINIPHTLRHRPKHSFNIMIRDATWIFESRFLDPHWLGASRIRALSARALVRCVPRIVPASAIPSSLTGFYAFFAAGFLPSSGANSVCSMCYAQAWVLVDCLKIPKPRLNQFRSLLLHPCFCSNTCYLI